jgi:hypothetical protein
MSKYTFQVAGLSAEEAYTTADITKTLGAPTVSPTELPSATRDLVVTAVDSRGSSTAVTKSVTIVPYEAPKVAASAQRVNGFENATTVKISGSYSRIEVSGTAKNTVNTSSGVQYRYRQQGTSTWGSWTNRSCTIDTATGKITVADFQLSLNNQNAYEFETRITDRLETTTVSFTVSVGQPAFYIGADGRISVGSMPSIAKASGKNGQLEVSGNAYANGNRLAELPIATSNLSGTISNSQIANGAVTSAKIGWSSMKYGFITKAPITSWTGSALTDAYTVTEAGVYFMAEGWSIAPNGYDYRVCDFYINRSRKNGVQTHLNERYAATNSYIATLAVGDTVQAAVWANSANFQTLHGWLCIFRIA